MREPLRDRERLEHMLTAINVLLANKCRHTLEEVISDPIIFYGYYGYVKQVEIIGEAVYKLTTKFREDHPEVCWDDIEGMRHVLVHGYYKIRPNQLWETVQTDIPQLKPQIEALLKNCD